MSSENLFDKIKNAFTHEVKAAKGEDAKDKLFLSENEYASEAEAQRAFEESVEKLFDVNGWSKLGGLNSTFTLHSADGKPLPAIKPEVGNYLLIELPGLKISNWVQVTEVNTGPDFAEFVVHPSEEPRKPENGKEEVKHFFTKEASSTFRVEKEGATIRAFEIGREETINNQGEEAGNRAALNTLIAEGGWAFFQKVQWDKITAYLVHKEEPAGGK
jgi:hypothetical protein